jgi:hypothetical protein
VQIEFVNHSSFLAETGPVRLLCDPWLSGTAFNDGWALLAPTAFEPARFRDVTHIWFSHEHPDHFAPGTLKAIAPEHRAQITVLYQATSDGKVAKFCRGLGFRDVVELAPGGWTPLAPGIDVRCEPWTGGDSWLALRGPGATLLNLNDCAIYQHDEVARICDEVGPVDVLATQFSISAWDGNPEERDRLEAGALGMLERMVVHANASGARAVIPFASFVWFCHEENFYLNAFHNRVDTAAETLRARTQAAPVVLYPGDRWEVGAAHDPAPATARWLGDYESLPTRARVQSPLVAPEELVAASDDFCSRVRKGSDALRLRVRLAMQQFRHSRALTEGTLPALVALAMLGIPEATVYLEDLDQAFLFTIFHGLRPVPRRREECDVAMSSDSLRYAFQHMWGGESLQVNGRFRELRPDGRLALFQYFWLAAGRNRGEAIGWGDLLRRWLGRARS